MAGPPLRLAFLGAPEFAVASLDFLARSRHKILTVVTHPDAPAGRGLHPTATPIAARAPALGLPLIQPESLGEPPFLSAMKDLELDLIVVVAFTILPESLLVIPRLGAINLHPSLLPSYRGASPIRAALRNGDAMTGVTTMSLRPEVDAGPILLQKPVPIFPDDNFGSLSRRLSRIGASVLVETVEALAEGKVAETRQDPRRASPAGKTRKRDWEIRWDRPSREVINLVRALSPEPGAVTKLNGKVLKVLRARHAAVASASPGETVPAGKGELVIGCAVGAAAVLEVQLEGKRPMKTQEFLRGHTVAPWTLLGE